MFYRRKIILALIELLGNEVERLRFQKLLFLYAMKKTKPEYDFVPYKFGCYSYSAKADMNTMVKKGQLIETEKKYAKQETTSYLATLKPNDKKLLREVVDSYGAMNSTSLIKHTYLNYPFYAIKSTIAKDVLNKDLFQRVENAKPSETETKLFTIGYEGISLEMYLQRLVRNNVKLLIDVRRNPLSMKFGFSKSQLLRYCNSLGIEYLHIPEVGIASELRQELKTQADYDKLFEIYRNTTLTKTDREQNQILELLAKYKRVALTCFEAQSCQCHRTHLAESISNLPQFTHQVKHL